MKTYDKMCPLTKELCYGQKCAFVAKGNNTRIDEDGKMYVSSTYHYCVVLDFMLTIINKE